MPTRQGDGNVDAEPSSKGSKKRRREEAKSKAKAKDKESTPDETEATTDHKPRKQMVRIRAKIHCTAAGLPGLDGPSKGQWKDNASDGLANLPQWHPLEKVCLRAASLPWLVEQLG